RRCLDTAGWLMPRWSTSSPTGRSPSRRRSRMSRRVPSASTAKLTAPGCRSGYIAVKAYAWRRGRRGTMPTMPLEALLREGRDALAAGRWAEARAAFERAVPEDVDGEARFGLATALWWSGEDRAGVAWCRQAYGRALHAGEVGRAVQCAV